MESISDHSMTEHLQFYKPYTKEELTKYEFFGKEVRVKAPLNKNSTSQASLNLKRIAFASDDLLEYCDNMPHQKSIIGMPVICIHGAFGNCFDFQHMMSSLALHNIRVFSINIPGFELGDKKTSIQKYSKEYCGSLIKSFLDLKNIKKAIFMGHSLGGFLSGSFAIDFPEHVAGLVYISGPRMRQSGVYMKYHKFISNLIKTHYDRNDKLFFKDLGNSEGQAKILQIVRDQVAKSKDICSGLTNIPYIPSDDHSILLLIKIMALGQLDHLKNVQKLPAVLKMFVWGEKDLIASAEEVREFAYEFTRGKHAIKRFEDLSFIREVREQVKSLPGTIANLQKYFCKEIEGEYHNSHVMRAEYVAMRFVEYYKCVNYIENTSTVIVRRARL